MTLPSSKQISCVTKPSTIHSVEIEIIRCFIGSLTKRGKKAKARGIYENMLTLIKNYGYKNPLQVIVRAITNLRPTVNYTVKRRGATSIRVPYLVSEQHALRTTIRWIIRVANRRDGSHARLDVRLAIELLRIAGNKPSHVRQMREEQYQTVLANRSFLNK